jgi:uncharacterized protein (DUF1501 family)
MSFYQNPQRPFEAALAPFLQAEGLPFADVLPAEDIQQAFDDAGVCFGQTARSVFNPAITLWAFLSQVLGTNKSCRAAVLRVLVLLVALGRRPCDAATPRQAVGEATNNELLDFVRRQATDGYGAAEKMARLIRGSDANYPASGLGERLRLTARLLKSDLGARVFYTLQSGYDTHASQSFTHANLLREFADAMKAFFADLHEAKLDERVALLAFSEFDRTIKENGSIGTDHGTTGCVFLIGPAVKGDLIGKMPSLTELEQGEPKMTTDFRRVYATVLDQWLNCPSAEVVGAKWEHLPLL